MRSCRYLVSRYRWTSRTKCRSCSLDPFTLRPFEYSWRYISALSARYYTPVSCEFTLWPQEGESRYVCHPYPSQFQHLRQLLVVPVYCIRPCATKVGLSRALEKLELGVQLTVGEESSFGNVSPGAQPKPPASYTQPMGDDSVHPTKRTEDTSPPELDTPELQAIDPTLQPMAFSDHSIPRT